MQALLDFVRQKPLAPDAPNHCPGCGSTEISTNGTASTLVGGANHHWTESACLKCSLKYVYEFFDADQRRLRNVWFTRRQDEHNHVLSGMPSCFETYTYDCAACGGPVVRRYTKLDGSSCGGVLTTSNKDGRWTREYRTFFDCTACKKSIETPDDHWRSLR